MHGEGSMAIVLDPRRKQWQLFIGSIIRGRKRTQDRRDSIRRDSQQEASIRLRDNHPQRRVVEASRAETLKLNASFVHASLSLSDGNRGEALQASRISSRTKKKRWRCLGIFLLARSSLPLNADREEASRVPHRRRRKITIGKTSHWHRGAERVRALEARRCATCGCCAFFDYGRHLLDVVIAE